MFACSLAHIGRPPVEDAKLVIIVLPAKHARIYLAVRFDTVVLDGSVMSLRTAKDDALLLSVMWIVTIGIEVPAHCVLIEPFEVSDLRYVFSFHIKN